MPRLLIIDDNPEDREHLTELARMADDVTVAAFATGWEGIDAFRQHSADCVLLDYRLDGEDGLSVLSALKTADLFVPVVIVTGEGDDVLAATLIKAGAKAYLPKDGLTGEKLQTAVSEAIRSGQMDRKSAGADPTYRNVLLVEDNADDRGQIQEMILAANGGVAVKAVATGTEALAYFDANGADCVILDYRLEFEDGIDILAKLKQRSPFCPVIMLTGQGNEEIAATSIKLGAADYLVKQ